MKLKFTRKSKAVFSVYILGEPEITTKKNHSDRLFWSNLTVYLWEKSNKQQTDGLNNDNEKTLPLYKRNRGPRT